MIKSLYVLTVAQKWNITAIRVVSITAIIVAIVRERANTECSSDGSYATVFLYNRNMNIIAIVACQNNMCIKTKGQNDLETCTIDFSSQNKPGHDNNRGKSQDMIQDQNDGTWFYIYV